jgi:hypothetical protein
MAPAVADNIATPVKPNQSQSQRPCFTLRGLFRTDLEIGWLGRGFSEIFRAGTWLPHTHAIEMGIFQDNSQIP